MALRLRRGTDAQRLLITPLEGELIYVTDTQQIYVGDGVTAGGVRVSGLVPENLEDLQNVSSAVPGDNDVLIWSAIDSQWVPIPLDTIAPGSTIASLSDVNVTGIPVLDNDLLAFNIATEKWEPTSLLDLISINGGLQIASLTDVNVTGIPVLDNDLLAFNTITEQWEPTSLSDLISLSGTLRIDINGSIFADDSTPLVDAINRIHYGAFEGTLNSNIIEYDQTLSIIDSNPLGNGQIVLSTTNGQQQLVFERTDSGITSDQLIGLITFDQVDDGGTTSYSTIGGWHSGIYIGHSSSGTLSSSSYVGIQNGGIALGKFSLEAGYKLDVSGNSIFRGNGEFTGDLTAAAFRGSLFADDSTMVVDAMNSIHYGTFEGTLNSNIIEYNQFLNIVDTNGPGNGQIIFSTTNGEQQLVFERTDSGITGDQRVGLITFDQIDDGGTVTYSTIGAWHSGIYIGHSSSGTLSSSEYVGIQNGGLALGKFSLGKFSLEAGYKLDVAGNSIVRGNGAFTGDLTAAAFKGSVVGDDSTIIIDAVNGDITASRFVQFGSLTSTERDALVATNGMVIYNTTVNKFQGYANSVWVDLH